VSDPSRFVRSDLRALPAYHLDQVECLHKLDQNEVPWDFPMRLKREASERLLARNWAHYPDFHGDRLRSLLAELHGWPMTGILVGNGSNELLGMTLEAIVGAGDEVLAALPTFGLYEMFVRRPGARPHFLSPREDLEPPVEELLAEIEKDPTRPLLLCTPNNPTGRAVTPDDVERLATRLDAPLLLDNAYGEFCRFDYRPLLAKHDNLVLFRTFSKAWSLAGIRLGYMMAAPELIAQLIKVKLPYNLGHHAAVIGEIAVEESAVAERSVRLLIGRRAQWTEMLRGLGCEVFESEANFLLVRFAASSEVDSRVDSRMVRDGLAARGILVREVGHYPGLEGCLRFAVGSGRALRDTRSALEQILQGATT
jgi:histidinol-phosphate aminotransferase